MEVTDKYMKVVEINLRPAWEAGDNVTATIGTKYLIQRPEPLKHIIEFETTFHIHRQYFNWDVGTIKAAAGCTVTGIPYDSAQLTQKAIEVAKALDQYIIKVFGEIAPQLGFSPNILGYDVLDVQVFTDINRQNDNLTPLNFDYKSRS